MRVIHPGPPSTAAVCGEAGWLATVGSVVRAAVLLLIPLAWLQGCLAGAMGMQLPPLQQAAVQTLTVLLLARRAPAGACLGAMLLLVVPLHACKHCKSHIRCLMALHTCMAPARSVC